MADATMSPEDELRKRREAIIAKRQATLAAFGIERPSGSSIEDLRRDLASGRRVAVERGFNTMSRAKGDPSERLIEFVCSTEGQKRDGNIVRANGFRFHNFDKNSVAPWGHDYTQLPCGRWVEHRIETVNGVPALVMTAQFAPERANPFAEKVYQCYLGGFLNAVSIGWEPLKYRELKGKDGTWLGGIEFLESDLLECSFVVVPADPDATARKQAWEGVQRACQRGIFTADEAASFARWAEIDRGSAYVLSYREDAPAGGEARAASGDDDGVLLAAGATAQRTDAAPSTFRGEDEKECPDCGAACSATAESCARCGYDFAAGKKVDTGEDASRGVERAPRRAPRRVSRRAQKRSELTDALDVEYDELRGLGYRFWEHIDRLGWDIDSMFYADKANGDPYSAQWTAELRAYVTRCQKRLASIVTSVDAALGRMSDALASIPGASEAAGDQGGEAQAAAGGTGAQTRVGKKISRSRLERLLEAETGFIAARDLLENNRALMRGVVDEAIDEARAKKDEEAEGQDGKDPNDEVPDEESRDGEADAEVPGEGTKTDVEKEADEESKKTASADPLLAEIRDLVARPRGGADAGQHERAEDSVDPLVAELEQRLANDPVLAERRARRTADGILAGLPGRE